MSKKESDSPRLNRGRIWGVLRALAIRTDVFECEGGLLCDTEPLACPQCGITYYLHYPSEIGLNQLHIFRYIAVENIENGHPRHYPSIAVGAPRHC